MEKVVKYRPTNISHPNDSLLEQTLQDAEQSFVQRHHEDALRLANQVLSSKKPAQQDTYYMTLDTRLPFFEKDTIRLSLQNDITLADRAAAIVLQTASDEAALEPFCQYYSTAAALPLELFNVLVQFLLNDSNRDVALKLSLEALRHVADNSDDASSVSVAIIDEMYWIFITKMLVFVKNPELLAKSLALDSDALLASSIPWNSKPSPRIMSTLLSLLEQNRAQISDECLERCREFIRTQQMDTQDDYSAAIVPRNSQARNSNNWYQRIAQRVLHFVKRNVIAANPLIRREGTTAIALTILSLFVAYKQKRHLKSAAVLLILGPIKEIMDALLPALKEQ